jgi:hypothetical protein
MTSAEENQVHTTQEDYSFENAGLLIVQDFFFF